MIRRIILLMGSCMAMIISNVEATPSTTDVTRAMVLAGEGPYKEIEVVPVKDGYKIIMVIKPMNFEETIIFLTGYSYEFDKKGECENFITLKSQHEFKVSFFVKEDELDKLFYMVLTIPKVFVDGGVAYSIDNIRNFIKKE